MIRHHSLVYFLMNIDLNSYHKRKRSGHSVSVQDRRRVRTSRLWQPFYEYRKPWPTRPKHSECFVQWRSNICHLHVNFDNQSLIEMNNLSYRQHQFQHQRVQVKWFVYAVDLLIDLQNRTYTLGDLQLLSFRQICQTPVLHDNSHPDWVLSSHHPEQW